MENIIRAVVLSVVLVSSARAIPAPVQIQLVPQGQVEIRGAGGEWTRVSGRINLEPGQEVRTKDASAALITFSDGSKLALSPNAQFAVEKSDRQETTLKLGLGKLRAFFAGYMSSRLSVRTPTAVAAVRGTEFELSADSQGQSEVNVREGHLEVSDNQGRQAVVTSEETLRVTERGMERPQLVSLTDERAQQAARPLVVMAETGKDQTRTMVEELRNRELKANEAQLGKNIIDAFGRRVRLEEYLLRPAPNQFKLLFLSFRENRFDWGHLIETFKNPIPNDLSQLSSIFAGSFFSKTAPSNWITYMEFFATNTVDSIKETITFGDPTAIDFSGFGPSVGTRYYPATMDYKQIFSGPGVPGGTRTQFRLQHSWNNPNPGRITWQQDVVNNLGVLTPIFQAAMNPANAAEVAADGIETINLYGNPTIDFNTVTSFPSGKGKADFMSKTTYADNSWVSTRKILVSNEGNIFDFANPNADAFTKVGNYNVEIVVGSSMFQGRDIDVIIAPEILSQKKTGTTQPDAFSP